MNLLSIFNKSAKGNGFRIPENPIKYIGYIFSETLRKGRSSNNAATQPRSNPSSTASSDSNRGTLPK